MRLFLVIFILLSIVIFSFHYQKEVYATVTEPWTVLLAVISAKMITLFDSNAFADGVQILLRIPKPGYIGVSIQAGCNGVEACLVLAAAILAFPLPWRCWQSWFYKIRGILYGFVGIQALNVVRIITLFYLGQWNLSVFDFAHEYAWQVLIILDAFVLFLVWLRKIPNALLPDLSTDEFNPTEHA